MKIYILGSRGMLGRYVAKYLSKDFNVVEVNRDFIDASLATVDSLEKSFQTLGLVKDDVVINCMGTIKTRVDELGDLNAIIVNSVFPRILANTLAKHEVHLIHPTTDCVYSGLKGNYSENDKYDVSDVYGMSKALGESSNCTIIRTSIIGEEIGQQRSLVEWVKSNAGKTVFGFTNHVWNGMTCLQFAKVCKQIIEEKNFWAGIRHIHSNSLTKKELVETISSVYGLGIIVTPKETPVMCDRTLSTIHEGLLVSFRLPTLEEQIIEMKDFSEVLSK